MTALATFLVALFGVVSSAVAIEAVRSGRATLRGRHYDRSNQPLTFRFVVSIYVFLGVFCLVGTAWCCVLLAREHAPQPAPQQTPPGRVASPLPWLAT